MLTSIVARVKYFCVLSGGFALLINESLILKISELAKLDFDKKDSIVFASQLSGILEHMKTLNELDVSDVEPMFHACLEDDVLEQDIIVQPISKDIILSSPYMEKDLFRVPSILEEVN